jgi:hypothetical protein
MRKDGAAHMTLSSFYKYVSLLNLKRRVAISRRKNHTKGIRATPPFQFLHADMTEFKTEDQKNAYIYMVQDIYSRAIVAYQLSTERRHHLRLKTLRESKQHICSQVVSENGRF